MLAAPVASRCVSCAHAASPNRSRAGRRRRHPPAASGFRRRGRCGCPRRDRRSTSASVKMPLSPTTMRSARDQRRELLADAERDLEGAQIPVVDADELGAERQRAVEFRPVVHLDQHVHAEIVRRVDQRARLLVGDARHDDEDAIRAPGARLEDLIGLEQEILAQGRQAGRLAGLRSGIRACPGTTARRSERKGRSRRPPHRRCARRGGSKSARMRPFEGLAFLTSAMRAGRPSARCRSMAAAKPRGGAAARGATLHLGLRDGRLRGRDLLALIGFDAGENVAHAASPLKRSRL